MHKLALLISVVVLSGCETRQILIMDETPRQLTTCHNPQHQPTWKVADVAQAHCAKEDLNATRAMTGKCGGGGYATLTMWRCVP
jgi:hypothetical protein